MRKVIGILVCIGLLSCSQKSSGDANEIKVAEDDGPQKEVVCFVYHRFGDNRFPSTNVSVKDFEAHLKWLVENDFQVLSLSEAIEYLDSRAETIKTAVITIDDGYKSFFKNGLPLLAKYDLPATLFINTETVGGQDYMGWAELKEASEKNIEIGNHTHSHAYFLNEPEENRQLLFEAEIKKSQQLIKSNLHLTPAVFAYPYGEFDDNMQTILKAFGFKGAVAQNSGVISNDKTVRYQMPRFPMSEAYANTFEEKVKMHALKVIKESPHSSLLSKNQTQPILTLTINPQGLLIDQITCFVQGGNCKMEITDQSDTQLILTLQAGSSIMDRRRTLYTLTVPDSVGNWYWYSHLWVNSSVK